MSDLDDLLVCGPEMRGKYCDICSANDGVPCQLDRAVKERAQLRENVETNLLKAAAMVDAVRGKCELRWQDRGYMPEIEEAKALRAALDEAKEILVFIGNCGTDGSGYDMINKWLKKWGDK